MLGRKREKPQPECVCVCVVRMWMRVCLRKKKGKSRKITQAIPGGGERSPETKENWFSPQVSHLPRRGNRQTPLMFLHVWRLSGTGTQHGTAAKAQKKCWKIVIFFTEPFSVCIRCAWRKYEQLVKRRKTHPPTHTHPVEKKKEDDDDESKW